MVGRASLLGVLFVALESARSSRLVLQLFDIVGGALQIFADALLTLCLSVRESEPRGRHTRWAVVCRLHLIFLLRQASQATFCLRVVPLYSPGGTGSIAGLSSEEKRGDRVMVNGCCGSRRAQGWPAVYQYWHLRSRDVDRGGGDEWRRCEVVGSLEGGDERRIWWTSCWEEGMQCSDLVSS